MPISYQVDSVRGFITEVWRGDIDIAEVVAFWRALAEAEETQTIRRSLADVRDANPVFTAEELQAAVRDVLLPARKGRDWISAILVESVQQFRLSRQYQLFEQHQSRSTIFSSFDEAMGWLLKQESHR